MNQLTKKSIAPVAPVPTREIISQIKIFASSWYTQKRDTRSSRHTAHAYKHFLLTILTLLTAAPLSAHTLAHPVSPYIAPRSTSENAARELVGWTQKVNLADKQTHYGSFSVTPEYTRSFRADHIAAQLFGSDLQQGNTIHISGSTVPNRNQNIDWLADYFYLPTSYTGSFSVHPRTENFLVDFDFYWGMDTFTPGLFFRIHAPLTWTQWNMNMCMETEFLGTATTGIIPPLTTGSPGMPTDFVSFSCGHALPVDVPVQTFPYPIPIPNFIYQFTPLNYSRLCPCKATLTRLADMQADFGWNLLLENNYHLGLFVRGVAPTGNRPHGILLFEPIAGNGKHWELGGGLTSHVTFWRSPTEENHSCGLYLDANITHLFSRTECRVFDLKQKPLSRYNLAFKHLPGFLSVTGIQGFLFSPVANLTAHAVDVSIAYQTNIAALFNYTHGNTSFDIGYSFWNKSCDQFTCHTDCTPAPAANYASVAGCASDCSATCVCDCPTFYGELSSPVWSLAGTESYLDVSPFHPIGPYSYSNATIHEQGTPDSKLTYLSRSDVDTATARTRGRSDKLFGHLSYTWLDHTWIPYLGLGAELEFAGNTKCCQQTTSCCANTALSQWGIWLKGGLSF